MILVAYILSYVCLRSKAKNEQINIKTTKGVS